MKGIIACPGSFVDPGTGWAIKAWSFQHNVSFCEVFSFSQAFSVFKVADTVIDYLELEHQHLGVPPPHTQEQEMLPLNFDKPSNFPHGPRSQDQTHL